jgi:hypothetical protein
MQVATPFANVIRKECFVGKYVIAWLLGVPAFVLVIVYLLFN